MNRLLARMIANWGVNIATAFVALRTNLMRSILTTVGVMIGVFAVILAVAVGEGAKVSVADSISALGSNMAIAREVLDKVPQYDEALGPGALGYGDDVLFSSQVRHAGYRIADALDVCVVHHPESERLSRKSWLDAAWSRGLSQAHLGHHWNHWRCRGGRLKTARTAAALAWWRCRNTQAMNAEGCDETEMRLVFEHSMAVGHLSESKHARYYEKNGLKPLELCHE